MQMTLDPNPRPDTLAPFFAAVFTASEGAEEGAAIGALVRGLLTTTPEAETRVFTARAGDDLVGAVLFTRLHYAHDPRRVWLLSPMAVATQSQGQGIGQRLIRQALDHLRAEGADVALTYGDPAFYGRVGFAPVSAADAPPPQPLSMPQGWIGQALDGAPLTPLKGRARCAPALDDPAFW